MTHNTKASKTKSTQETRGICFVLVSSYFWAGGLLWSVAVDIYSDRHSTGEHYLSLSWQVPVADSFLVVTSFQGWQFFWLEPMHAVLMLSQSLWIHTCISSVASGRHFPWSHPPALALTVFFPSLLHRSQSL